MLFEDMYIVEVTKCPLTGQTSMSASHLRLRMNCTATAHSNLTFPFPFALSLLNLPFVTVFASMTKWAKYHSKVRFAKGTYGYLSTHRDPRNICEAHGTRAMGLP